MSAIPACPPRSRAISLDDLILLNDELLSLISAGIPLDLGLSGSVSRTSGRLQRLTERLSAHVSGGMPLDAALDAEAAALPGEYRLIVCAGLRSGRLDEVLAGMTRYAMALRELRASIARALVYPLIVCGLAYLLLVGVVVGLGPELLRTVGVFRLPRSEWVVLLETLHRTVVYWGAGLPAAGLALLAAVPAFRWAFAKDGTSRSTQELYLGVLRVIPGIGGVLCNTQWSRLAHLLAVLIDSGVPFPEAARIAAAGVGSRDVRRALEAVSARVEAGDSLAAALGGSSEIPPILRWLVVWGEREATLAAALREAAAQYQQRALNRAEWVQRIVPVAIVALVGGGITAAYALCVFLPMTSFWKTLGLY